METPYTSAAVTGPINLEMLRTATSNVVELYDALLWAKPLISEIDDYVNRGERLLEETSLLFLKGSAISSGTATDWDATGPLDQLAKAYATAISSYIELRDAVYHLAVSTSDAGNRDGAAKLFGGLMAVELDWRDVRQRLVTPYLSEAIKEGKGSRWSEAREMLDRLRCHYRSSGEDWHQDVLTPLINQAQAHWRKDSVSSVQDAVWWVEFAMECQFFEPRSKALVHLLRRLRYVSGEESASRSWADRVEESFRDSINFEF